MGELAPIVSCSCLLVQGEGGNCVEVEADLSPHGIKLTATCRGLSVFFPLKSIARFAVELEDMQACRFIFEASNKLDKQLTVYCLLAHRIVVMSIQVRPLPTIQVCWLWLTVG